MTDRDRRLFRRGGVVVRRRSAAHSRGRRFWNQVNRNLVALISLVLAITSLGYNTWRNETTEIQRNWRQASFEILAEIGELERVILLRRYFIAEDTDARGDTTVPSPRTWVNGWGTVTMVRDLSAVMPEPLPARGQQLFDAWDRHAGALHDASRPEARRKAEEALLDAVEGVRQATIRLVGELS